MIVAGFEITVLKKPIKNIYLKIKPDGSIFVSAPNRYSDKKIEEFVLSHKQWIEKTLSDIEEKHNKNVGRFLFRGSFFNIIENISDKPDLKTDGNNAYMCFPEQYSDIKKQKYINDFYRRDLTERIERFLPIYSEITGLNYNSYDIRNMKTRFGVCNIKTKNIRFNLALAKADDECLIYIIIHELLHLRVANHGPLFKAELDKYLPNWRTIRNKLHKGNYI